MKDPWGNNWYIATFLGENDFSEGAPTIQLFLQPVHAEPVIGFLTSAFGATEFGGAISPEGVILHTTLTIGTSALEMIDICGIYQPMPGTFYLQVDDLDTVYARALEIGAESVAAPAGGCCGSIQDVAGNIWHLVLQPET